LNGYGGHDIQGIGDKHVTWIHNVMNMDGVVAVDDLESKKMLQVFTDEVGKEFLGELIPEEQVEKLSEIFGISGVANVLCAIKTAKYYNLSKDENVVTIATDNINRYSSVMSDLNKMYGKIDRNEAKNRFESIFMNAKTDWMFEGTVNNRKRWHNLKYYTWVEQQGKTVEELDLTKNYDYWKKEQDKVKDIDRKLLEYREAHRE
jgi:hypothetical protein